MNNQNLNNMKEIIVQKRKTLYLIYIENHILEYTRKIKHIPVYIHYKDILSCICSVQEYGNIIK
jgi:hypothetical protein